MKCDMHVNTVHSGMCTIPVLKHFCRESYNYPEALYESLKAQGMDLVTVTDHDSIDSVEALRSRPDFFLSEEVTCHLPGGTEIHVGVYDLNDRQHIEIQRRANDFLSLHAYLNQQELLYSANHIFSSLTGRRTVEDFQWFENAFPAVEARNGCMLERTNRAAAAFARRCGKAPVGGSDAHAMMSAGSCWTEVKHARNKQEFMAGVRLGLADVHGEAGSFWKLTRDVLWIGSQMIRECPATLPILFLAPAAPVITLVNYILEIRFEKKWASRVLPAENVSRFVDEPSVEEVAA
jgi:predicted metal-dependent phosphoesterase TrpH